MKRAMFLLLGLLLLSSVCNKSPTGPDGQEKVPQWPMFAGNLRNTSNAADAMNYYPGPQVGQIVWRTEIPDFSSFFGVPSLAADGTIYIAASLCDCVSADSGAIFAINPDGTIKWRFITENSNFGSGAVGSDGSYFYRSLDGYIYAIDAQGSLRWQTKLDRSDAETGRPVVTRSGEVIISVDTAVIALNEGTGERIWSYPAENVFSHGISIDNDGSIYTGTIDALLALTSDGKRKWKFPVKYGPGDVVIGAEGTLYFNVSDDSLLYAVNPDGSLAWTFDFDGIAGANRPGIGPDGSIYTINCCYRSPTLFKVSSDGRLEWSLNLETMPGVVPGAFLDVGNSVPMIDADGNIYLTMSRTGGDNLFSISQERQVNWSVHVTDKTLFSKPAFASDGTAYIAGGGAVAAIK